MFVSVFRKALRPAVLAVAALAAIGVPLAASAWQGADWNTGLRWSDGREVH